MVKHLKIVPGYCKGCNICVFICPRSLFAAGKEAGPKGYQLVLLPSDEKCTDFKRVNDGGASVCELCILSCPEHAIRWDVE